MSRKINLLNDAVRQKEGEVLPQVSRVHSPWIMGLILVAIFAIILGLNLKLYSTVKSYAYENDAVLIKLNNIEKILGENKSEIKVFSNVAKKIVNESERQSTKITELKKQTTNQAIAIQDLINAKDALFGRVGSLEAVTNK